MQRIKKKFFSMVSIFWVLIISNLIDARGTVSLPKTGQNSCYNTWGKPISCAETGHDGEIQAGIKWPSPRFLVIYCNSKGPCPGKNTDCDENSSTDVVMDNLTGLMWARNGNPPKDYWPWEEALSHIDSINKQGGLCGYTNWRLPNINELESLVHAGEPDTATWLNTQGFVNVQSSHYWSSTSWAKNEAPAWVVDLKYGHVSYGHNTNYRFIWHVRSEQKDRVQTKYPANLSKTGQRKKYGTGDNGDLDQGVKWPDPRFTDRGDGTVIDHFTGLMWTKDANASGPASCSPGKAKTFFEALNYVACVNSNRYLGFNDWRLPNRKEFYSLIDYSKYNPALPSPHPFTNVQSRDDYWSNTTAAAFRDAAWTIDMVYGRINHDQKRYPNYVWPLRGGVGLGGPDLTGSWQSLDKTCKNKRKGLVCNLKGTLEFMNNGSKDTLPSVIKLFLSDDRSFNKENVYLIEFAMDGLKAGEKKVIKWSYLFPIGETASGKYIIALIDANHSVLEEDEDNNEVSYGPLP